MTSQPTPFRQPQGTLVAHAATPARSVDGGSAPTLLGGANLSVTRPVQPLRLRLISYHDYHMLYVLS